MVPVRAVIYYEGEVVLSLSRFNFDAVAYGIRYNLLFNVWFISL